MQAEYTSRDEDKDFGKSACKPQFSAAKQH